MRWIQFGVVREENFDTQNEAVALNFVSGTLQSKMFRSLQVGRCSVSFMYRAGCPGRESVMILQFTIFGNMTFILRIPETRVTPRPR